MTRLYKFIDKYENMPIGLGLWLASVFFIIFIRDGFESIVINRSWSTPDSFHLLHFPLFFFSLFLAIIVALHLFSKTDIVKVSKISLVFFCIIIFPVTFDFIFANLAKNKTAYLYIESNLWENLPRFFDFAHDSPDFPRSIRIEIAMIILMSFGYIYLKRRKIFSAFSGALTVFILCFLAVSLPAVLKEIFKLLGFLLSKINLQISPFPSGPMDESILVLLQLLTITALGLFWLRRFDILKYQAIIKNARLTRSLHYCILCLLGVLIKYLDLPVEDVFLPNRIAGALLAVFFAFHFSVVINDLFDIDCDRLSNKDRPLITGALNKKEYLNIGCVFLCLSLLFAYWVSESCVMIILLFIALYFVYSAQPFRLKRLFPISACIIGLEAVFAFAAGEAALDRPIASSYFHGYLFWPIFLIFSLGSNIKDLKDVQGDRAMGVVTLPILLGEDAGRKVIAFLVFLSYCLVPYFLRQLFPGTKLLLLSLCFALASFVYILNKKGKEKIIFVIYFAYVLLLVVLLR